MSGRRNRWRYAVAIWLSGLAAGAALGDVWYVDDDAPNDPGPGDPLISDPNEDGSVAHPFDAIQEAIDAADPNSGDEVVIADGTYTGSGNKNLDLLGKPLTVRSASGNPARCIVDCEGDGRGFYFHSGEWPDSIVDGLTVTNGYVQDHYGGGGIYCADYSDPTLRNCVICSNVAGAQFGGGVYCSNSSPTLIECVLIDNVVLGSAVGGRAPMLAGGGGICCRGGSAKLISCRVEANAASGGYATLGGGVLCGGFANPALTNCTINANKTRGPFTGGSGVSCFELGSPTLVNCTIAQNTTAGAGIHWGGGLLCFESSATVTNCVIWGKLTPGDILHWWR